MLDKPDQLCSKLVSGRVSHQRLWSKFVILSRDLFGLCNQIHSQQTNKRAGSQHYFWRFERTWMKFFPLIAQTSARARDSAAPFLPIEAVINECGVQNAGDHAQVRGQVDGQARFVRFQLSLTSISGLPLVVVTHAIQVGSLEIHTEKNH